MDDGAQGFRFGGTLHPWGTRFDALVPDHAGDGYASRELACGEAFGFRTTYVELTAPRPNRPVTVAAYEIADVLAPKEAFARLVIGLGQPDKISREEVGPGPHASNVVALHAVWKRPGHDVSVSLYGAPRPSEFGDGIGKLYLSWSDLDAAAAPFLAPWSIENEAIAQASATATPSIFTVRYPIFDPDYPTPSRQARVLNTPELFETPADAAKRLGTRAFALWSDPGGGWYLSHGRDTIRLGTRRSATVQVLDIKPARGSGFAGIEAGSWTVRDVHGSRTIADAAAAIRRVPGLRIERVTGHDA
ncbi:MAG: hypothetical protein KIT25_16090 [Enhydrobacter sp.]|nr:MAG: hypothetical protein KIT25_16090 [Enhydrobacter sp.]